MNAIAQGISHSPVMHLRPLDDRRTDIVSTAIADAKAAVAAFDPELVIVFGPDHYNGFFYELMPPFCVGAAANGIGDYDTRAGAFNVDREMAMQLHAHLLAQDFDAAVSHDMRIDHSFAQPVDQLLDRSVAFVPVFINCIARPVASCRRVVALGRAIGEFCRSTGKRTAFLASGGLSHDAPLPDMVTVSASMRHAIIEKRELPADERAARQKRTLEAADAFAEGQGPLTPLNEAWDVAFMDDLAAARWSKLAALNDDAITRDGGRSGHEIRTWLAAFSALQACGPYTTSQQAYAKAPEWIVGYAALRGQSAD